MKLSRLFWLCKLGVLAFFILLILGLQLKTNWLTVLGVVILVISAALFQIKYRCPYCGKVLDSRKLKPQKVCPHCGQPLE